MQEVIEPGGHGATYHYHTGYSVYGLDVYPSNSVLAGQQRRVFLGHYDTVEVAQAAHPGATVIAGTTYQAPSLSHLPDGDDV
jgi:hypothetical protein